MLIENGYDKSDVEDLYKASRVVRKAFNISGQTSRHINRIGFTSEEQYEYIPPAIPVEKKNR